MGADSWCEVVEQKLDISIYSENVSFREGKGTHIFPSPKKVIIFYDFPGEQKAFHFPSSTHSFIHLTKSKTSFNKFVWKEQGAKSK